MNPRSSITFISQSSWIQDLMNLMEKLANYHLCSLQSFSLILWKAWPSHRSSNSVPQRNRPFWSTMLYVQNVMGKFTFTWKMWNIPYLYWTFLSYNLSFNLRIGSLAIFSQQFQDANSELNMFFWMSFNPFFLKIIMSHFF